MEDRVAVAFEFYYLTPTKTTIRAQRSARAKDGILLWVDREAGHGQGKPLKLK